MKKELKSSQGFICKDLDEKKRIWQKLTDAGYPMFHSPNYENYLNIVFIDGKFCNFGEVGDPLNESEFFGETEWTPKAGEWVEVSSDGKRWIGKRQYLCSIDDVHLCVMFEETYKDQDTFNNFKHIRQIPPIQEMTIAEAEEKFKIKIKQS